MKRELLDGKCAVQRPRMGDEFDEKANGLLPEAVCEVAKGELQKYMKCKRVGNYLLGKTIGEGSFARVKQGFHVLTGEKVAVKIIDKKRAHQDKYVARNMRREAKIMQMIRHPHIVQLLEVVETEHRYYLITELAAGGDLMDYICYRKKLGEVEVRKFIRQTVSAVHYLHQGGILHRDLKVENLLLDDDYNIKIIDFGLSNTVLTPSSENQATREFLKTQCGSPAYAAPEILGHKPYGPEVDAWSIGVNMYAMLTGKLPYTAEPFHITALYNKMKNSDMNPLPEHLSAACKDLIQRFLTFNRDERITLEEALGHAWLRKGYDGPVIPVIFPSYPRDEEIDKSILQHMTDKMEFDRQDVIDAVRQNRSTCSSTVYHLLKRKLKKYSNKHRVKSRRSLGQESTESVRNCHESNQEIQSKNESKQRTECSLATAEVCDFNEKEHKAQKQDYEIKDVESSKLKAPSCRSRLSSHSQDVLSMSNEKLSETVGASDDDKTNEKHNGESGNDAEEKDETCSILSSTGIEISRKNSFNYSSAEVMAVKGRRLSLNLSHISVGGKATTEHETMKNTSENDLSEREVEERKNFTENAQGSPRRSEGSPPEDKSSKSPRNSVPATPSIGKVSLINAKVISIPLPRTKEDPGDKVKVNKRRFSFPQSCLPSKNLGISQHKQFTPAPFGFNSASPSTDGKSRGDNTPVLPPYGLCCQLTAIKAQEEATSAFTRAKEDKPLQEDVTKGDGLEPKNVQLRRSVYCPSPYNSKERNRWKRHSIASSGGKELLKSINNTLGKLLEVQENAEPMKTLSQECLLLRSRGSPLSRNESMKPEPAIKDLSLSLTQENAFLERSKERRNQGMKISSNVKDNHKLQLLSNHNAESRPTKDQVITREKNCRLSLLERTEKRRSWQRS